MKVFSQLLGRYSSHNKPLILFRLPDTDTLFYRLSDIEPLFSLPSVTFDHINLENCYRDQEDTYLNTKALAELALKHSKYLLAELCKLSPVDYNNGLADSILQTFPEFKRAPSEEHVWESVQLPLENLYDVLMREKKSIVKSEPMSPPALHQMSDIRNAMALDKVLLNTTELRRHHPEHPNKRYKTDDKRMVSTVIPIITTQSPNEEDTCQKKRLSNKHKNALNLTIFAPSYSNQYEGIRSAPLHSNFNKPIPPPQPSHHPTTATLKNLAPASATIARPPFGPQPSPRRHEFAIPPIVPSQQQPPVSAHTAREGLFPHPPSSSSSSSTTTATTATTSHYTHPKHYTTTPRNDTQLAVNAANVQLPPKTPTTSSFAALQRQQYLQPFEHLFDTIETTRTLKSTLDDQIRRSSTLMQTLQTSATTMEGLIRNQIKEAQWDITSQLEQTLKSLSQRIQALENRLENEEDHPEKEKHSLPSPLPSATKDDNHSPDRRRDTHSEELQIPPTIVRSQNDIGPQEYHNMLTTLKDRLDRLERQIET